MAERCPDCGLVQKSPPPYSSGCYCDYHCAVGKLCEERAEYRARIAELEAQLAAVELAPTPEEWKTRARQAESLAWRRYKVIKKLRAQLASHARAGCPQAALELPPRPEPKEER